MNKVGLYNPGRLLISTPSLDLLKSAERYVARKAQSLEERELEAAPVYLEEVVQCFNSNQRPSKKAIRRVAAGSLPDLISRPNGGGLLGRFLDALIDIGGGSLYKSLLLGYLRIRHSDSAISRSLREVLLRGIDFLPERWRTRIEHFGLLETPPGQKLASIAMTRSSMMPMQVFEEAGLRRGILLGGGFAANAFAHICEDLSLRHDVDRIERFFSLLPDDPSNKGDDRVALTEGSLPILAKALLAPYLQVDPDDDLRLRIIDVLVRLFRDPRLNATGWAGVDQDLIAVLLRWLTAESFEMLMEVLNSSNQSAQWRTRERFWRRYVQKGYVREAWVVFGPDAERQATKLIRSGELRSRGSFGVLDRSQIQGHHSVLLMKIGDLTIAEWTHDGKVRFYRSRNTSAPAFYKLRYDPEVLRFDSRTDHYKVHLGHWQYDVERYIRDVTGLRP